MISDKLKRILQSKTDLSDEKIAALSEAEGWSLVYANAHKSNASKDKRLQVCFTGFGVSEKAILAKLAEEAHLRVVSSVTKDLQFLVSGDTAGPAKLQKAREQGTTVLSRQAFMEFLETGELK